MRKCQSLLFVTLLLLAACGAAWATQVPTPNFNPNGGTFGSGQNVAVYDDDYMATIHYTTNGNDPTESDPTVPFMPPPWVWIGQSCTLKAKAWRAGYDPSNVKSAVFVIDIVVATPTFNPDGGTYNNTQNISMYCSTSGATIRYTTDGTDPTDTSTVYSSAVAVTATGTTLKAKAFKTGWTPSGIKSGTYTLTTATPTCSPDGSTYNNTQNVTISCTTTGATIRYTTDGSDPTDQSTVYSSPVSVTATNTTIKAKAWKTNFNDSSLKSATYTLTAATPTFSPDGSTYNNTQNVTMSCTTTGATIRYTTDGTDPTSGSAAYSSPVAITATATTLKAKAFKTDFNDSALKSATYTLTASTPTFNPDGGTFQNSQNVTMSCTTTGATIRYTTDNTEPTSGSTAYSSPVAINTTTTLKAKAFKTGFNDSGTKSATYTMQVATPTFNPDGGILGGVQYVTISTTTTGATIHYTLDGTDPTEESATYTSAVTVDHDLTLKAKAWKDSFTPSAIKSAVYDLRFSGTVETPTLDPGSGEVGPGTGVKISCTTSGVSIYYTVDNSEPTESSFPYDPNGVVVVAHNLTLKAKAFKDDYVPSTGSAWYTMPTGGPPGFFLYQVSQQITPQFAVWVSDIYEPKTMRVQWSTAAETYYNHFDLKRDTTDLLTNTTERSYVDPFSFEWESQYQYKIRGRAGSTQDRGLPAPPQGADPSLIYTRQTWTDGDWQTINVTPIRVSGSANQAVDSRLDARYATTVYADVLFGGHTYRGGLFAGKAADPSRVGRSFLKFSLPTPPEESKLWAASVNAYNTRSAANGSTTVGCQYVADDTWTPSTLKWTNAPTVDPTAARHPATVTYDGANPAPNWCFWPLAPEILAESWGDRVLSVCLASTNEATNGWAYFAKSEYDSTKAPEVLMAYDAPDIFAIDLMLNSSTVASGHTVYGTVYVNHPAPTGGAQVTISSDVSKAIPLSLDPQESPPGRVTIPAGETSAPFVVSAAVVTQQTQVTICSGNRTAARKTLTINP